MTKEEYLNQFLTIRLLKLRFESMPEVKQCEICPMPSHVNIHLFFENDYGITLTKMKGVNGTMLTAHKNALLIPDFFSKTEATITSINFEEVVFWINQIKNLPSPRPVTVSSRFISIVRDTSIRFLTWLESNISKTNTGKVLVNFLTKLRRRAH